MFNKDRNYFNHVRFTSSFILIRFLRPMRIVDDRFVDRKEFEFNYS